MEKVIGQVGNYRILDLIGKGGMAQVYLAKLVRAGGFEKIVALKVIRASHDADTSAREMFEKEAQLTSHLKHPNIVEAYDFVEIRGSYWLAMEYVRGRNLSYLVQRLREKGSLLPIDAAVFAMIEICKGLEYAHSRAVVHCDISPQNVMISCDGEVKLLDFGIAVVRSIAESGKSSPLRGKLNYLAPEQIAGEAPSPRSDLFSAAAVLYELVTGSRPGFAEDKVPEALRPFFGKALAIAPHERYATAGEMQRDLECFLSDYRPQFDREALATCLREVISDDLNQENEMQESKQNLDQSEAMERRAFTEEVPEEMSLCHIGLSSEEIADLKKISDQTMDFETKSWTYWLKHPGVAYPLATLLAFLGFFLFSSGQTAPKRVIAKAAPTRVTAPITSPFVAPNHAAEPAPVEKKVTRAVRPKAPAKGTLKLVLNRDAKVYLDGKLLGQAKAHRPWKISLEANRKKVLRFRNPKRGIDVRRSFVLKPNVETRKEIALAKPSRRHAHRPSRAHHRARGVELTDRVSFNQGEPG